MPTPAADEDNLQDLIAGARRTIERAEAARASGDRHGAARNSMAMWRWALAAMLCLAAWFLGADVRRMLWGTPEALTMAQSKQTLAAAREAVEKHHEITGSWPERVPLPHLDALVQLTHPGEAYELRIQLDGQAYTMGRDGQFARSAP